MKRIPPRQPSHEGETTLGCTEVVAEHFELSRRDSPAQCLTDEDIDCGLRRASIPCEVRLRHLIELEFAVALAAKFVVGLVFANE